MIETVKKFIQDNGLSFEEGSRNTDSVILAGFCLHLGVTDLDEITDCIDDTCDCPDDYYDEFERVFEYAEEHNYENYWKTPAAKKAYKF